MSKTDSYQDISPNAITSKVVNRHLNDPLRWRLSPMDTSTYLPRRQLLEVCRTWSAVRIGRYASRPPRYQVCPLIHVRPRR